MCNFFSGIITKDKKVLTDVSDSHSEIKKKYNLNEPEEFDENISFYPFEITPKDRNIFYEPNEKNWKLSLSVSAGHTNGFKPKWYNKTYEKIIWETFKKVWSERVFQNIEIEELKERKGLFIKDCIINRIIDTYIIDMHGSSIVKNMCGSSTVKNMYDSSTVETMRGSSTVKDMRDSSTVENMLGSSTVENMCGSSTVKNMRGSSTVENMLGSSTVENMYDSSTVENMWDSSTVENMWGSSTVKNMWDSSTVKNMNSKYTLIRKFSNDSHIKNQNEGVCIDYTKEKIEVSIK